MRTLFLCLYHPKKQMKYIKLRNLELLGPIRVPSWFLESQIKITVYQNGCLHLMSEQIRGAGFFHSIETTKSPNIFYYKSPGLKIIIHLSAIRNSLTCQVDFQRGKSVKKPQTHGRFNLETSKLSNLFAMAINALNRHIRIVALAFNTRSPCS